ncbi:hypothetical protein EG68_08121 [Paragonimus skrjabini miyazakii]|uniref:Uncharacterized protein n=1 Tax=Paragonimus skrjabini miyazakii TaxID=59628 RepID=A0A8S9YDY0_9TREM|nr:hypothetical protein EG68_08121 [Paragonimus skrjabini miyazakii]
MCTSNYGSPDPRATVRKELLWTSVSYFQQLQSNAGISLEPLRRNSAVRRLACYECISILTCAASLVL